MKLLLALLLLPLVGAQSFAPNGDLSVDVIDPPTSVTEGTIANVTLELHYQCHPLEAPARWLEPVFTVELAVYAEHANITATGPLSTLMNVGICAQFPGESVTDEITYGVLVGEVNATATSLTFVAHPENGYPGAAGSDTQATAIVLLIESLPEEEPEEEEPQGAPYEESPGLAWPLLGVALLGFVGRRR